MNVSCGSCRAVYRVDPARVPGRGVTARCARCGAAMALATPIGGPSVAAPADDWFAEERAAHEDWFADERTARDDWFSEESGAWSVGAPSVRPVTRPSVRPSVRRSRALEESEAAAAPEIEPEIEPAIEMERAFERGRAAAAPRERAPAPWPVRAPEPSSMRAAPRHPFRQVDPHVRAQRLARALVSDLIAYHPGRREAADAAGTLRLAFRDEIARAYAVYVAEVGRELAKGTSYFQEALNEMLAQGRALF